jgi:uncharacterized membrane protein
MRLQEIHPALVHYPIAFLPTALAADALGRATGSRTLSQVGRWGMALAAGSAAVSAVAGLLAQEASRFDEETRDLLVTHRTLNLAVVGLAAWMAVHRARAERPGAGYLAAGAAGVGVMAYSAYLGGHMVYEHGVGIKDAGGLREEDAPHLVPEQAGDVVQVAGHHVVAGLRNTLRDMGRGRFVPWLTRGLRQGEEEQGAAPEVGPGSGRGPVVP